MIVVGQAIVEERDEEKALSRVVLGTCAAQSSQRHGSKGSGQEAAAEG